MKKILGTIFIIIYAIIAITTTILLLSYNEYNCSVLGNYTFYLVKNDELEPDYNEGDLLIIKKTSEKNVHEGDKIFLYKVMSSTDYTVVFDKLEGRTNQGKSSLFSVEENGLFSSQYFIGKESDTIAIPHLGTILSILESRWGYLCCVVIVSLVLFLEEIFELVMELKYGSITEDAKGV